VYLDVVSTLLLVADKVSRRTIIHFSDPTMLMTRDDIKCLKENQNAFFFSLINFKNNIHMV
jgi:hypothetical protein